MKDAYDMEDKEVLDRLACAHINFAIMTIFTI